MRQLDLEVAGEFLVMAATLMRIKAKMLLPLPAVGEEEEEGDPREVLVQRLVEYRQFKEAAGTLKSREEEIEAANGDRLLLSGDIEAGAEQLLVARYGEALRSDVLIAPHHGSRTSATPAFIRAVAPAALLIPAGHRNRYGFPHPTISARYRAFGTPQWRTGESGALQVRLDGQASGLNVLTERQRDRRYWHLPAAVPPER